MENVVTDNKHGNFEDILSEEDWQKIVKRKLNTTNFKILKRNIKSFSDVHVGFLGDHLTLQATVAVYSGKEDEVSQNLNIELFAKTVPKMKEFGNFVDDTQSYLKEYKFYLDIIPDLKKHRIQDDSSWTCQCYLAKPDILVLENLVTQGFQHCDCKESINYKHCVVLTETLARFHAESVIFEEKESCTIADKHSDILFETFWSNTEGHPGNDFMHSSVKAAINLLQHQPDYNSNQEKYKLVKEKCLQVIKETCEFVKPSKKYRNVIIHGDVWSSNVFFRYNENGEPTEVRLVDFQLFRYNPPAHEVMCFLYLVSNRNFRKKYLDEMLTTYYRAFSSELQRHGLNPDELQFSWPEFKESCDFYQRAARILCILYYQNIVMKGDYLKDVFNDPEQMKTYMRVDKTKFITENYLNDPKYRERNHEVMQEMFEFCILNQ